MAGSENTPERLGAYRILKRVSHDEAGDVFLARLEGPEAGSDVVVLKLLATSRLADDAPAYAQLSHPTIVQLYDVLEEDGRFAMVLEYVDGPSLQRLRGMLKTVGRAFDAASVLYLGCRLFTALAVAHQAGVVHRNVDPSNILVSWDGEVKLAGLGIVHEAQTFGYLAPEQVTGGDVGAATDVYAAAIVIWEMLARRRAFQRGALPEREVLRAMAEPRIPPLDVLRPDLDPRLRGVLSRALEPAASARTITAEEIAATLQRFASEEEGRERLGSLLATVRHEPRPSWTSLPPEVGVALPSIRHASSPDATARNFSLHDAISEILRSVPSSMPPASDRQRSTTRTSPRHGTSMRWVRPALPIRMRCAPHFTVTVAGV